MKKLSAIGEALIDFIPEQRGCALQEVEGFRRRCGGAPANVAAVCGKLEIPAQMIGCVGADAFDIFVMFCKRQGLIRNIFPKRRRQIPPLPLYP